MKDSKIVCEYTVQCQLMYCKLHCAAYSTFPLGKRIGISNLHCQNYSLESPANLIPSLIHPSCLVQTYNSRPWFLYFQQYISNPSTRPMRFTFKYILNLPMQLHYYSDNGPGYHCFSLRLPLKSFLLLQKISDLYKVEVIIHELPTFSYISASIHGQFCFFYIFTPFALSLK